MVEICQEGNSLVYLPPPHPHRMHGAQMNFGDLTPYLTYLLDDIQRAPTELVQHSASRVSSHRRNVTSCHIFNMAWLYRSPIAVGGGRWSLLAQIVSTCLRGGYRRGEGEAAPCVVVVGLTAVPVDFLLAYSF
jgi:hypothetical protein